MLLPLLLLGCSQESSISAKIEQPPQASIQAPFDGDVLSEDDAIEFVGLVSDGNGLGDLVAVIWESDKQGELATQDDARWDGDGLTRFATTLDPGTHAISLTVIDSSERTGQASISVTVEEVNTAPTAEITSPGAFESFALGSDITLIGGASDPNQPAEQLVATWTVEPELGGSATEIATGNPTATGTVLTTWEEPPLGSHRLRLRITDAEGQEAEAQVVINVEDPNAGDADQDEWTIAQGDCDDNDPSVNPSVDELCNGIDDDCNGDIDDKDADGDNHVDLDCVDNDSSMPADDCDDLDPTTFMGAPEQADGADNDCDGRIDNGLSNFDNDGDCACSATTCIGSVNPKCLSFDIGDCDDNDPDLHPYDDDADGYSTCDGDCDDLDPALNLDDIDGDTDTTCATDCDDNNPLLNGLDVDNDTFSSCDGDCNDGDASQLPVDLDGDGASSCAGDCNDADPLLNPHDDDDDGFSTCDGDCDDSDDFLTPVDDDGDGRSTCDGDCDDDDATLNQLDNDSDGFSTCDGDCNDSSSAQNLRDNDSDGYSTCTGDCDDAQASLNADDNDADGYSTCDGDCDDGDGGLDPADIDGDGYSTCDGDCDDNDPLLEPDDADNDGYSTCDGDCDDSLSLANPGRPEVAYNGIDDDCVGGDLVDVDGDGYISDVVSGGTDCNDDLSSINPGQPEVCGGADENCNGVDNEDGATGCQNRWTDNDGDGFGVGSATCTCDLSGATEAGDCYDDNSDAHPDQTSYFQDDRGDGSWDYDCNGNESRYYNNPDTWSCSIGFSCTFDSGWVGGRPECGESAEWNYGCYYIPFIECNPGNNTSDIYDQICR